MNTLQFKTNINCGNCIAKVTPILNAEDSIISWEVDTHNPEKILTVKGENIEEKEVIAAVARVGFRAESI